VGLGYTLMGYDNTQSRISTQFMC